MCEKVKKEDLNGRGVQVNRNGRILIGHWKKGKLDGLTRFIFSDGSK
jgi:hypothetical protein